MRGTGKQTELLQTALTSDEWALSTRNVRLFKRKSLRAGGEKTDGFHGLCRREAGMESGL